LLVFFKTHDPTTLNRQGNDAGTQYRSVIFYESPEQKAAAESMIDKLEKELVFDRPIVTEITPISKWNLGTSLNRRKRKGEIHRMY
jgi:peptide-methionine (S)-S-oxide reductase